jgi:hypothetical protein
VPKLRTVVEAELYAAEGTEGSDWDVIAPGIRELVYLMVKRAISSTSEAKHVITHEVVGNR